jgi:hypothetical protein
MNSLGSLRGDSLCVSWQTRRGLGYALLKLKKSSETITTIDALAEHVLGIWLNQEHPDIVDHMRQQYDIDQTFRKQLESDHGKITQSSQ